MPHGAITCTLPSFSWSSTLSTSLLSLPGRPLGAHTRFGPSFTDPHSIKNAKLCTTLRSGPATHLFLLGASDLFHVRLSRLSREALPRQLPLQEPNRNRLCTGTLTIRWGGSRTRRFTGGDGNLAHMGGNTLKPGSRFFSRSGDSASEYDRCDIEVSQVDTATRPFYPLGPSS